MARSYRELFARVTLTEHQGRVGQHAFLTADHLAKAEFPQDRARIHTMLRCGLFGITEKLKWTLA